jgi:hypothetical protein
MTGGFTVQASAQESPAGRAFEHYEQIRAALAQDTTAEVAKHAHALTPLAAALAGDEAAAASESIAKAENLDKARDAFGKLSELIVPKFMAAGIEGAHGFICPMNQKRWVQRGATAGNPYYGKSMATCATALKEN